MSKKTQKLYTSRTNNLDANTYVGEAGRLFYNEPAATNTAPVLRYSDGVTVGGVPLFTSHNILPADAVGFLYDDGTGNLSWSSTPTNYNDSNVAIYLSTTANLDLGNLYITDETIHGKIADRDITLAPAGVGSVSVRSLKIPVGSIISNTNAISVTIASLVLDSVVDYSTSTVDNLQIGDYGLTNGISGGAPGWSVYRFTTTPAPVLAVGDHLAATGMPFLSTVLFVGNVSGTDSANANIVITSQTVQGLSTAPVPGAVVYTTRDVVNQGFVIKTQANSDISMIPGPGGSTITAANFLPLIDDVYDLGSPTRRWRHLWMGAGTIYVLDETLGTDQTIGARDGNLYVGGGSGLTVGKFTLYGNLIALTNSAEDFNIGVPGATGNLNINRPITVIDSTGHLSFRVDRTGRTSIYAPTIPAGDIGAFSINGSASGAFQPVTAAGGMIHVTGNDGAATRLSLDNFSNGNVTTSFNAIVARAGRGTAASPSQSSTNDILFRLAASGWRSDTGFSGVTAGGATTSMDIIALEPTTNATRGTAFEFFNSNLGGNARMFGSRIDSTGLSFVPPAGATVDANIGITFNNNTRQVTAWVPGNNIQQITVGTGFDPAEQGTNRTGNISLDTVDVHSVASASYSLTVANITPNSQNLRLTLAQEIGTNSSPTFGNVTVTGNLFVTGNIINAVPVTVAGINLYLGNAFTTSAGINTGGIILGNVLSADHRTLLYRSTGPYGDYWTTNTDTGFQTEHLTASDAYLTGNLFSNGTARFGGAYTGYDFPNAGIQVFENTNSYAQIVEQNLSTGTRATTDFIATANNGTDTTYYVDLGIAGSNYNNANPNNSLGTSVQANDSYLYAQGNTSANIGGNLVIGATVPGRVVNIIAGGVNANNIVETISNTGVAVTGNITATGNIGAVYYTGSARYLTDIPVQVNADWNNVNPASFANIRNRPDLSVYATVTQLSTNVTTLTNSINTLTANAAYQEGEIAGLRANITAANVNIQNISANLGSFETYANITYSTIANAASLQNQITGANVNIQTLTANVGAYETWANATFLTQQIQSDWNQSTAGNVAYIKNKPDLTVYATTANVGTIYTHLNTLDANVGAFEIYSNANVGSVYNTVATHTTWLSNLQSNVNTINANVGAYETWANATIQTISANLGSYETWANATIQTISANLGSYETWANSSMTAGNVAWQANAVFQNTWLSNLQSNITTVSNSITNISGNAALTFVSNAVQSFSSVKNTLVSVFGLTNGVVLTTNTRYQYELVFNISYNKNGSIYYALALGGGAAVAQHNYTAEANKTTTVDGYTAGITMMSLNATGATITTAGAIGDVNNGFGHFVIRGTIDVTTGGTVNFMISQDQNTPVTWSLLAGAYIRLFPLGAIGGNTVIGTWT